MIYLIVSDIHSNQPALDQVLATEKADEVLFLGDIIGYGASPEYCYQKFRDLGGKGVMGNHEYGAVRPDTLVHFSENAMLGVLHSMKVLSKENLDHMQRLPETLKIGDLLLCHTMLGHPLEFPYVFPQDKDSYYLKESFQRMAKEGVQVLFTGHTHKPCIFKQLPDGSIETYKTAQGELFLDEQRYVINAGSVGQPRNGSPLAHYVLYDTKLRKVTFRSVSYDVDLAAKKIREAGLPDFLADRLYRGI